MIQENTEQASHDLPVRDLLERAADEAGNFRAVARRTGISRRRLGYLLAGQRPVRPGERMALTLLVARRL